MDQPKGKYSNGRPVDIPKDKEELEIAIKEWAEGNPHLEEALCQCIDHGVITEASCAGHGRGNDDPYIAMKITDETRGRIYSILNVAFQKRSGIRSIDIHHGLDRTGRSRAYLSIHAKPGHKDEIFDAVAEGAKKEIELEQCSSIVRSLMDVARGGEELGLVSNDIGVSNIGPTKAVILLNDSLKKNNILYARAGMRHSINFCATDAQVLEKLESIAEAMGVRTQETKPKGGLFDGIRHRLIERLERDLAPSEETVDLTKLKAEDREEAFIEFGEGSPALTRFLRTAYEHGAPSMFSCSGHGVREPYAMLRVTDENLEMLQDLGKVLSKYGVTTNFENHHQYGKRVSFRKVQKSKPINWLDLASDVLEHPEQYNTDNPSIYYHEEMSSSYKPLSFDIKMRLLQALKAKDTPLIPDRTEETGPSEKKGKEQRHSWDLTEDEKKKANSRDFTEGNTGKTTRTKRIHGGD